MNVCASSKNTNNKKAGPNPAHKEKEREETTR